MLLTGAGWQQVVSFNGSSDDCSGHGAPSLALRRQLPEEPGTPRCRGERQHRPWSLLQPVGRRCGVAVWHCRAVLAIGVPSLIYVLLLAARGSQLRCAGWGLYLGVLLLDLSFSAGQPLQLGTVAHLLVLAGLSLLVLPIAVRTALPQVSLDALTSSPLQAPAEPSS